MFSYRHTFHAGNFADVFKHVLLLEMLDSLQRKEGGLMILDTHAGTGHYDFSAKEAQKNQEFNDGAKRVFALKKTPVLLANYLSLLRQLNLNGKLRFYPGSPQWIQHKLRPQDRLIACEALAVDFYKLKQNIRPQIGQKIALHQRDGYEALKAFTPPPESRGLILIDPSYEDKQELHFIAQALQLLQKRWRQGVVMVWYPIISQAQYQRFQHMLQSLSLPEHLLIELRVSPEEMALGMGGNGFLVLNPPYLFAQKAEEIVTELQELLARDDIPPQSQVIHHS